MFTLAVSAGRSRLIQQPRLIVTVPGVGYRLAAKPKPLQPSRLADADQCSDELAVRAESNILAAFNQANAERDVNAISALYTNDATMIKAYGLLSGRIPIKEMYAQFYEHYSPNPSKLEHVMAIGREMMLRAGSWSGIYKGPGGPVHLSGCWTTTDVQDGTTWKIHTETNFMHSGSYVPVKLRPAQQTNQADAGRDQDDPGMEAVVEEGAAGLLPSSGRN